MSDESLDSTPAATAKKMMLAGLIAWTLLVLLWFIIALANAETGFDGIFLFLCLIIVAPAELFIIVSVHSGWEMMSTGYRWGLGAAAVLLPPLVVFLGIFLIGVGLLVFIASIFMGRTGSLLARSTEAFLDTVGGSVRLLRDSYGNRVGSVEPSGEVHDKYGNRQGHVDAESGTAWDRYGNRVGSTDEAGVVRDRYGNVVGSFDNDAGVIRDKYGKRTGSID